MQRSTLAAARFLETHDISIESAAMILKEAHSFEPENPGHIRALVELACRSSDWKAGCEYGRDLPLEFHSDQSILAYATCLEKSSDLADESQRVYSKALELDSTLLDIRIRLSQVLLRNKRTREAVETLKKGLDQEPSNIRIRYTLGVTELAAGNPEEALAQFQALVTTGEISAYRSAADIHWLMGKCLVKMNLLNAAMDQLQMAGTGTDTLEEMYTLGTRFIESGDRASARRCWEYVYAADVRFRDVAAKIAAS